MKYIFASRNDEEKAWWIIIENLRRSCKYIHICLPMYRCIPMTIQRKINNNKWRGRWEWYNGMYKSHRLPKSFGVTFTPCVGSPTLSVYNPDLPFPPVTDQKTISHHLCTQMQSAAWLSLCLMSHLSPPILSHPAPPPPLTSTNFMRNYHYALIC